MTTPSPFVQALADGIHVIDTGFQRPNFDAAYLLVENGRAAFIDTGTNDAVPRLLGALAHCGLTVDAVDWVILTHVHLDHAGGAGTLMQQLPHAQVLVHPQGRPHMIKPRLLSNGTRAVYGEEEASRLYGEIVPIPAARLVASSDGMAIDLAGRELQIIHTPGHASHHHCIWDEQSRGFFTGDTFGLSYREFNTARGPWLLPTTTPVQFDPELLRQSVRRMMGCAPERLYLTHYGCVEADMSALGDMMFTQLGEMVSLAESLRSSPDRHDALKHGLAEIYLRHAKAHGCTLPDATMLDLLALDIDLNAQGLAVWLDNRANTPGDTR
jgi:glyoxylase-like metal-dependent hydrolase (beta-lactamase superfamily II)